MVVKGLGPTPMPVRRARLCRLDAARGCGAVAACPAPAPSGQGVLGGHRGGRALARIFRGGGAQRRRRFEAAVLAGRSTEPPFPYLVTPNEPSPRNLRRRYPTTTTRCPQLDSCPGCWPCLAGLRNTAIPMHHTAASGNSTWTRTSPCIPEAALRRRLIEATHADMAIQPRRANHSQGLVNKPECGRGMRNAGLSRGGLELRKRC